MPENFTSINLIAELLETNLFGNTALMGLFIIFFFVIILLVARSFAETALMIPLPVVITLSAAGVLPNWVTPLVYIVAGFYLATVILIVTGLFRR